MESNYTQNPAKFQPAVSEAMIEIEREKHSGFLPKFSPFKTVPNITDETLHRLHKLYQQVLPIPGSPNKYYKTMINKSDNLRTKIISKTVSKLNTEEKLTLEIIKSIYTYHNWESGVFFQPTVEEIMAVLQYESIPTGTEYYWIIPDSIPPFFHRPDIFNFDGYHRGVLHLLRKN